MKKNLYLFLVLFMLLLIPLNVKADMGPPSVKYPVRVSDPNGVRLYKDQFINETWSIVETDVIVPRDTLLVLTDIVDDYYTVEYNNKHYYIKPDGLEPQKDRINLNDYKLDNPEEYKSICSDSYLYEGPSTIYGKVADEYKLPEGVTIKVKYRDDFMGYIEYDGHKGWIALPTSYGEIYGTSCLMEKYTYKENTRITAINAGLYQNRDFTQNYIDVIPANSEIKILYIYYTGAHTYDEYVSYNGKEGWVHVHFNTYKYLDSDFKIKLYSGATMYLTPFGSLENDDLLNPKKEIGQTIPQNTELDIISSVGFQGYDFFEVEYNGKTGWIEVPKISYDEINVNVVEVFGNIPYYKEETGKTQIGTLQAGDKIKIISTYSIYSNDTEGKMIYFEKEGTEGKVNGYFQFSKYLLVIGENDPKKDKSKINITIENQKEDERKEQLKKNLEKRSNITDDDEDNESRKVLLYSVTGCIVVVATALSILIIRVKKNKNNSIDNNINKAENLESINLTIDAKTEEK